MARDAVGKSCTVCVKTFLRPDVAARSIESAQRVLPEARFHVCDDGDGSRVDVDVDEYLELPFDSGVGAGKNALLDSVKTEYVLFMDDDTVWDEDTRASAGIKALEQRGWLDMVGFRVEPNSPFYGTLERREGDLVRRLHHARKVKDGVPLYDFVVNFFVARTDSMVRWDDRLKTMDHMDFFWRARQQMDITRIPGVVAENVGGGSDRYAEHRYGRKEKFDEIQKRAIGVGRFRNEKSYNGWKEGVDPAFA